MDLYFEMYSGIAGDMVIGSLLDLGASREKLVNALSSMDFGDYELVFERVKKKGIDAYNFDVILNNNHGHKHSHVHNHEHEGHDHSHIHNHEHEDHEHSHCHNHEHSHVHRNLLDVTEIINSGNLSDRVKKNALRIFDIIADAEAKAHGVSKNEVHFHEVGAIDSIIDVVGICVLIEDLNPEHIYFTEMFEGRGFVKCAHGSMPVPAPAVLNIITENNLTLNIIDDYGEHITPTGAAVAACFGEGMPPYAFNIKKVGIGAGNREFENSTNVLRVMEIENSKKKLLK